ncbi:hypothetical protein JMJ77_0006266, partial [Colletotrichum scovillei]
YSLPESTVPWDARYLVEPQLTDQEVAVAVHGSAVMWPEECFGTAHMLRKVKAVKGEKS